MMAANTVVSHQVRQQLGVIVYSSVSRRKAPPLVSWERFGKRRWSSSSTHPAARNEQSNIHTVITHQTEWPKSFQDFVHGSPIVTRPLPLMGRVTIDFGTTMMNFGAITSLTGFVMTDVLYLRTLSIVGSTCGIIYNITRVPKQLNAVAWGVVFIAVNLTRTVQLLLEQREISFTVEEADVYYRQFQPHGVEPAAFKSLLKKAEWKTIDMGQEVVESGKPLNQVHILVDGSAVAYDGSTGERLYSYTSRDNGSIIGATAVVDPSILGKHYPNRIVAEDGPVRLISFHTRELRSFFSQDHHGAPIEAALLHLIYVDLIGSLRRHRRDTSVTTTADATAIITTTTTTSTSAPMTAIQRHMTKQQSGMSLALNELKMMLIEACAQGTIVIEDRRRIREFMEEHRISNSQFKALLQSKEIGWTESDWKDGAKSSGKARTIKTSTTHTSAVTRPTTTNIITTTSPSL